MSIATQVVPLGDGCPVVGRIEGHVRGKKLGVGGIEPCLEISHRPGIEIILGDEGFPTYGWPVLHPHGNGKIIVPIKNVLRAPGTHLDEGTVGQIEGFAGAIRDLIDIGGGIPG